ncbi:MAG: hypothetical protein ACU837_16265 [Gammaproteobacteria bacterium]
MTSFGFLMMVASYSVVVTLMVYCFYRVLKTPGAARHEHAPLEIDTRDSDLP